MSFSPNETAFEPGLDPGMRVEVRNHFDGAWSSGFEVDARRPDGYSLRRLSDRVVLPRIFTACDIRLDVNQA
ncbi:MAG TPA: hypothetical protein VNF50_14295 [Acidimicrobiales bacterium]|nr:hypothetical protein [Acidimicrobiales bacterium]